MTRWKLGAGLLALGMFALAAATSEAATPNKFLPDDADAVIRVNVKDLLATDIVKKNALEQIKAALRENIQLGLVFETLAFDPLKDIKDITLSIKDINLAMPMGGGNPGGGQSPIGEVFVVVHGSFDLDKFHATLAEAAKQMPGQLTITEQDGFKVYEGKQNDQPMYVVFLDKETAVASNKKNRVHEAIAVQLGKRKPNPNRMLVNMLAKVSESQSVILALPLPKAAKDAMRRNPQTAVLADKLEGLTGSITAGKDADAEVHIHTTDAQVAQQLRGQIEGFKLIGAAFIQGQNVPGAEMLADLIQSMKTNADGKVIALKISLTQDMLDKAKKENK